MPIPLGILAAAGIDVPVVGGSYDLLSTTILTSNTASVTFASLGTFAADYQHLQVRYVARGDRATFSQDSLHAILNADTNYNNYATHTLVGDGSGVASNADTADGIEATGIGRLTGVGSQTGSFNAGVLDILDPFSTVKNTTLRTLSGQESQNAGGFGGRFINLTSTLYINTGSVSSLQILPRFSSNLIIGSRFSLYGLRKV